MKATIYVRISSSDQSKMQLRKLARAHGLEVVEEKVLPISEEAGRLGKERPSKKKTSDRQLSFEFPEDDGACEKLPEESG